MFSVVGIAQIRLSHETPDIHADSRWERTKTDSHLQAPVTVIVQYGSLRIWIKSVDRFMATRSHHQPTRPGLGLRRRRRKRQDVIGIGSEALQVPPRQQQHRYLPYASLQPEEIFYHLCCKQF